MLSNTILFFFATQISYFSLIGFGSLLREKSVKNIWLDYFINFFIGLILLNLLGQILYYLSLNSEFLNLFIIIVGFYFFLAKCDKNKLFKIILLNFIFFSGILISKLHEDWSYHFNFIEQITTNSPIIGIGNVDDIHILSASFFSFVQKIFYLPLFEFKFILIPVYLVYLNILIFLIQNVFINSKKLSQIFIIILAILVVKLARISEFGYDYLSNLMLLKIFILYLINDSDKKNNILFKTFYLILFLYAISIKVTALFFTPILIYIFISDHLRDKKINLINKYNFLFILMTIFIFFESFIRSGCFVYFVEATCLNNNLISWSIDFQRVIDHSTHVELWAKGFYIQNYFDDPNYYLDIKNWFNVWFYNHFFYKVFEFMLIPFFLISYFFIREKIKISESKYFFLFLASILSILLWLFYLPQLRFGFTNIVILFISLYLIFIKTETKSISNKKSYFIFISILIIFFNLKNFDRIYNEFNRNDVHKFSNFPFPPEKRILKSKISKNSTKFLVHEGKKINVYKRFIIIN